MAIVDAAGVVTKETKYGDTSRILTVVTKNLGRISILAGNARKGKSGLLTASGDAARNHLHSGGIKAVQA